MDYKDTLNLPRTDFAMKADLVAREPQRLKQWQTTRLYERIQAQRAGAPKFVLHDGPPFTNGDVHIGNALNKTLKDIVIRYQTLRGQHAPFIPGWDTHGLPIEYKVTQEMRKAGQTSHDPATVRRACEAYARKYMDIQRGQFERLGVLGDWDRPYVTLDPRFEADQLRLFADLVEKGFVYRGKKPVYWSIPCRTALAEAEVEYHPHVSQSVFVKFPVVGRPKTYLLIWTTTPWTLPANLAVAYNSTFSYSLARVGDEAYLVSTLLLSTVSAQCGWEGYEIIRSLDAGHVCQVEYEHPFCRRTGKLFAGDAFVDNTTGTGFVHIAPGHGLDDYRLGLEHGLPIYSPVNDDGCFALTDDLPADAQMPAEFLGKTILEKDHKSEANEVVLRALRERQMLVRQENYEHSYPFCWRSKTPVIFRAMDQWFINVDHARFRDHALAALDAITWVPDWGKNRIAAAVKGRPDWCISRQRAWGVPIPAFLDAQGRPVLEASIVRNTARLFEQLGSNAWFEKPLDELWAAVKPADWNRPAPVAKSTDTLDVWIDSGSTSRTVLMRRPELDHGQGATPWVADVYLEGSDQHRGWFQSSLLLSLGGNGCAPYKAVLTHGFMVDADREKIAKSKQASAAPPTGAAGPSPEAGQAPYQKPHAAETYIKRYGADVVRLWVASQDFRNDIVVSEERINKVGETYRVIRNALRYQLSNLYDFDPATQAVPTERLSGLDRWILGEYSQLEAALRAAYDRFEFHSVYQRVSQFAAVELSAIYHDVVKDRLYTDAANSPRRRSTQTALWHIAGGLCRMLSPILAFTADEAWAFLPGRAVDSVHLADWPAFTLERPAAEQAAWTALFQLRVMALSVLEEARQAKQIGKSLEARLTLSGHGALIETAQAHREALRELLNVSQLDIVTAGAELPRFTISRAHGQKCERCWHWETDVGAVPAHPTLCARCVTAVGPACVSSFN